MRKSHPRALQISKALSYWLRYAPAAAGLTLDQGGWADAEAVRAALARELGGPVTRDELESVVAGSDKQRFSLIAERIRANQGHSIAVDLGLLPAAPPATLFHGTTAERAAKIWASGDLSRMTRQFVHLSHDAATAQWVAARHRGERPLLLAVDAQRMAADGFTFYRSENGVWLTAEAPRHYLTRLDN